MDPRVRQLEQLLGDARTITRELARHVGGREVNELDLKIIEAQHWLSDWKVSMAEDDYFRRLEGEQAQAMRQVLDNPLVRQGLEQHGDTEALAALDDMERGPAGRPEVEA